MTVPAPKVDRIVYFVARCPSCPDVDLGIDQHIADAWQAYTSHCRTAHADIVQIAPMVRTMTWAPAPPQGFDPDNIEEATP